MSASPRVALLPAVDTLGHPVAREQRIRSGAAEQAVNTTATLEAVVTGAAVEHVGGVAAGHDVIARPGRDILDVGVHVVELPGGAVVADIVRAIVCPEDSG